MGANPTQARGVLMFLVAFVLLAAGLAGGRMILLLGALVGLGVSAAIFLRCKPWEHSGGGLTTMIGLVWR